jgi:hypothetical protein
LFLLLLFDALEGVAEGVAGGALLFVGVGFVFGGFLEVVGFADDFEGLGDEFFVVEFEAYAEERVFVLAGEDVDACFDGDEFAVGGEVGDILERGGADEGDFAAGLAVVGQGGGYLGLAEVDCGVLAGDVDQEGGVLDDDVVGGDVLAVAVSFLREGIVEGDIVFGRRGGGARHDLTERREKRQRKRRVGIEE